MIFRGAIYLVNRGANSLSFSIRQFRSRLKEAYPDAAKFIERIAWLDGTDEYLLNCSLTTAGNLGAYCYEGSTSSWRESHD